MQFLKTLFKTNNESSCSKGDWFTSKEHYLEFIAAFKKSANDPEIHLNATHFLIYAILRNKDWREGWTVPKKPNKLEHYKGKMSTAFGIIKLPHMEQWLLSPFEGTITTEMLMTLRENLQDIRNS